MTDASESIDLQEGLRQSAAGETVSLGSFAKYADDIDLDEIEKFTDQWANNPHNGDTIYSLAWMEGPESARTEASATLTVSGLLALVARVRDAERLASARRDTIAMYERENADWEVRFHEAQRRAESAEARIEQEGTK